MVMLFEEVLKSVVIDGLNKMKIRQAITAIFMYQTTVPDFLFSISMLTLSLPVCLFSAKKLRVLL